MSLVESYAPCPCGSGQKYKWCCQKVEAYAVRVQRLWDNGQLQAAREALDEGLHKEPGSPLLHIRKAELLTKEEKPDEAKELLRDLLRKQPEHRGAQLRLLPLVLETEGGLAAVPLLQQVWQKTGGEESRGLGNAFAAVAALLAREGHFPAALKHLEIAGRIDSGQAAQLASMARMIESSTTVSPWEKNRYALAEPPASLAPGSEPRARFAEALAWAGEGRWSAAAAVFELLAGDPDPALATAADRNLGLCRLWLGEIDAAATALRRSIARAGATVEAVDIEALCQELVPSGPDDLVELVQWIWPLRDRAGLVAALQSDPTFQSEGSGPINPEDPDSPVVSRFLILDRARIEGARGLSPRAIPRLLGRLLVGPETVALESFDDGRLDTLAERFTTLAGAAIVPAHPKTKVLQTASRSALALAWEWAVPEDLDRKELNRLIGEQWAVLLQEVWPKTPMPFLRGRTPRDAAAAGTAEVPLRAAVLRLERSPEAVGRNADFGALRSVLKLGPEPTVDPEQVDLDLDLDLEQLPVARLALVPVERLSDQRLVAFFRRARQMMQTEALERACKTLIARPAAAEAGRVSQVELHASLAGVLADRDQFAEAHEVVRQGRQSDPAATRAQNAPIWDMLDIQLESRSEPPEHWVPELAVILARYGDNPAANETVLWTLVQMGLVSIVPADREGKKAYIDPRPLQALMSRYGPRVTTASGQLGVSAAKDRIWTPGSATGGGGGSGSGGSGAIWTPGSTTAPTPPGGSGSGGGEKPKLVIPGR
jgi:tetratricopeptide (TPR) repeat protein